MEIISDEVSSGFTAWCQRRPLTLLWIHPAMVGKQIIENVGHSINLGHSTMLQNNKESRSKYWATRLSVCSFARTAHSFTCSTLLYIARFACSLCLLAMLRSFIRLLTYSLPSSWKIGFCQWYEYAIANFTKVNDLMANFFCFFSVLDHSANIT